MDCPLCKTSGAEETRRILSSFSVKCVACGTYSLGDLAAALIENDPTLAFKCGAWTCQQNSLGMAPEIDRQVVDTVRSYHIPNVKKRAELYLGAAIKAFDRNILGTFDAYSPALRVASWSYVASDCFGLSQYLIDLGAFAAPPHSNGELLLVAKGHLIYEEMVGERSLSSHVFVAMSFNSAMSSAYDKGIAVAIVNAGYDPVRVDRQEHDGKIDDRIVAEIRRCAFVVADFTDHRAGVYYEAGFAHGLGRRVIFTCQSDHIEKLHFDVRQYNTLLWDTHSDLVAPLQNRILALFGAGPNRPNAGAAV